MSMICVDDDGDRAALLGVHDDRMRVALQLAVAAEHRGQPQHGHDLSAVLHDLARPGPLDLLRRELLEAGDHVQRHRDPVAAGADDEQPLGLAARRGLPARFGGGAVRTASRLTCERRATAWTSRMSATRPSPRIVAPA